jgi:hypothetical protein
VNQGKNNAAWYNEVNQIKSKYRDPSRGAKMRVPCVDRKTCAAQHRVTISDIEGDLVVDGWTWGRIGSRARMQRRGSWAVNAGRGVFFKKRKKEKKKEKKGKQMPVV